MGITMLHAFVLLLQHLFLHPNVRAGAFLSLDTKPTKQLDYMSLLEKLVGVGVKFLTSPLALKNPTEVTNLSSLKRRVVMGDVLLVSGNARVSSIVKVLTTSHWSHVVLYVGDRSELLTEAEKLEWSKKFGKRCLKHLLIDADPLKGVHLRPLDEYMGLMVRHCRPEALSPQDIDRVIESALSQLGLEYDIKHILNLLIFFALPWRLFPKFIRSVFTDFRISREDRICSRVLSEAFHSVGYPIRPVELKLGNSTVYRRTIGVIAGMRERGRSAMRLLVGGRVKAGLSRLSNDRYMELKLKVPRHITPADYDLSRFFSIIKDKSDLQIEYHSAKSVCAWQ